MSDDFNQNNSTSSDPSSPPEEPHLFNLNDPAFLRQEIDRLRQDVQTLLRERAFEQQFLSREKETAQKRRKRAQAPAIFLRGAGAALALTPVCFVLLQFLRHFLGYVLCHILDLSLETVLLYGCAILIGLLLLFCAVPLAELLCWEDDEDDLDIDMEN